MFYLERFKRRERVVAPRTPGRVCVFVWNVGCVTVLFCIVTDVLQTSNSQYIRTLCDYYASVVYWNIVCGHTPNVSNKSCST
ncbi:hypothetical protein T05_892 [Trichinella murrelli]|uniref:Uncharacterized protein n=1 Tax=Trichinella murrelli TaxID=144512 RepID=A0A0V0SUL2_9BILA|nr:hypothetical protein T05_892 [Trichinella murrelli]